MKLSIPFLSVLLCLKVYSAEVSVTLTAERTAISLDEPLELQVSVQGIRQGAEPELLNTENFEVQGTGTSSQVQIVNGRVSQELVFGFSATPKREGKFKIGPARITVGGKHIESNAIDVIVAKGSLSLAASEKYFYIKAEVENSSPFVNQQVNYTFRFFNRASLTNAQVGLPEFKGFLKEGPDRQKEYGKVINGTEWRISELRFALFPVSQGTLTIEPAKLVADAVFRGKSRGRDSMFDDFFGFRRTQRVNLRSETITLNVNPLPTPRPPGFSGLVGELNLKSHLSKTALAVGDSSTFTVTIDGGANLRDFTLSPLSSPHFKIYEDQPTFELTPTPTLWRGAKTFKRALVPLKSGELVVPSVQLSYFDPSARSFKVIENKALTMVVSETPGSDTLTHVVPNLHGASKKNIEILGKDLMPIRRSPSALRADRLTSQQRILVLGICLICPLIFCFVSLYKRKRDRLTSDLSLVRRQKAYREFMTRVKTLPGNGSFFEGASTLLRQYLGDKFNLDGGAITSNDTERKLKPHSLSSNSIQQIESFLKECERGQYGGLPMTKETQSHQRELLLSIVQNVEKEVGR